MNRLLIAAALLFLAPAALAKDAAPAGDARAAQEASLTDLKAGNARFVEGKPSPRNQGPERRTELTKGQHPKAIVLSCSDSRVPPELVFDQQLGEIFVIRTAGEVAGPVDLGSIEYAVEHLGTPVIVVMGHTACGAVKATAEAVKTHGHVEGNLGEVVKLVTPAVKATAKDADPIAAAIKENEKLVAASLVKKSPVIAEFVKEGKVKIVTATYDLGSGQVDFAK